MTLAELSALGAMALDGMRDLLANPDGADGPTLADLALVSIACSLYRLQALPARSSGLDPLDLDPGDPPQSATEYMIDEIERTDTVRPRPFTNRDA
jgi:hypothetical protein